MNIFILTFGGDTEAISFFDRTEELTNQIFGASCRHWRLRKLTQSVSSENKEYRGCQYVGGFFPQDQSRLTDRIFLGASCIT